MSSAGKDIKQLLRRAKKDGCKVRSSGSHYKVFCPKGLVILPKTPSDHRSILNARSELRRHGVHL